jgi:Tfp pilus assembly protein PilZ
MDGRATPAWNAGQPLLPSEPATLSVGTLEPLTATSRQRPIRGSAVECARDAQAFRLPPDCVRKALHPESVSPVQAIPVHPLEEEMVIVRSRPRDVRHFRELYESSLDHGGLHCATTTAYAVGARVLTDVYFPGLPNPVLIQGAVVARRAVCERRCTRGGVLVAFDKTEIAKRDFLLSVADQRYSHAVRREHVRLPVDIPVRWSLAAASEWTPGALRDISVGGMQLVAREVLDVGSDIGVNLAVPGRAKPARLDGRVVYANSPYYGIQFSGCESGGGGRRRREIIRRLAHL